MEVSFKRKRARGLISLADFIYVFDLRSSECLTECKQADQLIEMSLVYNDVAEICSSKERLISWLREKELLGDFGGLCFVCSKGKLCIRSDSSFSKDKVCWRCSNGKCNKKLSIREGSGFSKSNLLLEQIVDLLLGL